MTTSVDNLTGGDARTTREIKTGCDQRLQTDSVEPAPPSARRAFADQLAVHIDCVKNGGGQRVVKTDRFYGNQLATTPPLMWFRACKSAGLRATLECGAMSELVLTIGK